MKQEDRAVSRRDFMRSAASAGAAAGAFTILGATAKGAGRTLKVGLVGCGGRGGGALGDHLFAAKFLKDSNTLDIEVQVAAMADFFEGRARNAGKARGVPPERCFGGPDAYKKLLDTDIDIMLTAAPPVFRPVHFEAAVQAGKHVFMEKPVAVDAPGVRRVIKAGEEAEKKGLIVVAGTQRRHEAGYNRWRQEAKEGAFGRLMAGRVAWNMGGIFHNRPMNPKRPEDLCRSGNWQLWIEMSGDHIVEQHVHNLDIANWFVGTHPDNCGGFGHRHRRKAGNMYDFFSVDFEYKVDGRSVFVHSMCRQIGGCWQWTGEQFTFERGKPGGFKLQGPVPYADIPHPRRAGGGQREHIHLLYHLVKGKPLNEARNVAWATAAAIMGRDSAYTGRRMSWREMFEDPKARPEIYNKQLRPTAEDFETGNIVYPKDGNYPIPGK